MSALPGTNSLERARTAFPMTAEQVAHFWEMVDRSQECWLWTGSLNTGGYGRFSLNHRWTLAHRIAYFLALGELQSGLTLDHLCRVRSCVNPAHLEQVSLRVNTLRGAGFAAEQARRTSCIRGHALSGGNLYVTPQGERRCRKCRALASRELRARRRVGA